MPHALGSEGLNPPREAMTASDIDQPGVGLSLETIRDGRRFASLGSAWDRLVEEMPRPSPFLLHGWLREWWRFYGDGADLAVHVAWRGDRLVGALPLVIRSRFGIRTARFMGEGRSALADLLLAREEPDETGRLLAAGALDDDQHVADLFGLPGRSRLVAALPAGTLRLIERAEAPVLDLSAGWDEIYRRKTGSKTRKKRRWSRRQLGELGDLKVVVARTAGELGAALSEAFRLHELRWAGRPDLSRFTTSTGRQFHRAAIRALAERGTPRIVLLTLDGRAIAFHYYFALCGRMVVHRLAFDPALARYSPGLLNTLDAIETAAEEGLTVVEFLGGMEQYKMELSDRLDPIYQGLGLTRGPAGQVAVGSQMAALGARRQLKRIPAGRTFYFERLKPLRQLLRRRGASR